LGAKGKPGATGADRFKDITVDPAAKDRVAKVETPVLIQVGTADSLIGLDRALYQELKAAGKTVRLEIYENGYHDFVMGPQGQPNRAEPLLDITLKAMENSLEWVK
jgi:acetyl esterase/lipase